jgi:uncharacterized membrane protein YoaK (UPF0700 family)
MVTWTQLRQAIGANVPLLLSFNGGYVDTMSFLALRGLFAAHVTGNFVTLGASLVHGTSGAVAKLLALPTFCIAVIATRLFRHALDRRKLPALRSLLLVKSLLLIVAALLAVRFAPFGAADGGAALLTGMTLVSAMAIQNAVHRVHLAKSPPSTLMTGTTTQIMLDIADLLHGAVGEARETSKNRTRTFSVALAAFAGGCGGAALLYSAIEERSFFVPAAVALLAVAFAPNDNA